MTVLEDLGRLGRLWSPETEPPPPRPPLQKTSIIRGEVKVDKELITWRLDVPAENLVFDGMADFIGGFGGITHTSVSPSEASAQQGVATLHSKPPRGNWLDFWESVLDPQERHARTQVAIAEDLRSPQVQRKLAAVPNGERINVDKKVVRAHSMGSLAATRYAELEPEAVYMLIKEMGVGYGTPTLKLLAERVGPGLLGSMVHEIIPAQQHGDIHIDRRTIRAWMHYYLRMRTLFEGLSCLTEDVRGRESFLKARGIAIGDIVAKYDILVPPYDGMETYFDHFHKLLNAGHLAPQVKPHLIAATGIAMIKAQEKLAAE